MLYNIIYFLRIFNLLVGLQTHHRYQWLVSSLAALRSAQLLLWLWQSQERMMRTGQCSLQQRQSQKIPWRGTDTSARYSMRFSKRTLINPSYKLYLQENIFIFCVTACNKPGSKAEDGSIDQVRNGLCQGKCDSVDGCFTQARSEKSHNITKSDLMSTERVLRQGFSKVSHHNHIQLVKKERII